MVEVRLLNMEVGEEVGMKGDMPDPLSRNWENFSMMRWDGVAMRGKGGCGPWDYFSAVCIRGRGCRECMYRSSSCVKC